MVNPWMKIVEYIRRPDLPIPIEVVDKIYEHHALPMSYVRESVGLPIYVSFRSGFRPVEHEIEKERDGKSEHVFEARRRGSIGWGAADYTCYDMGALIEGMAGITDYSRLCYYSGKDFIHADYRFRERGLRFFVDWEEVSYEKIKEVIG